MKTPYQWHQDQLERALYLDPDLMPAAIADPENGHTFMAAYFMVIADGFRSLLALGLASSGVPVVLVGKEDSGASS